MNLIDIKRVSVYCASSGRCDPMYLAAAYELGQDLARNNLTVIFGGGAQGLMGSLADGAIAEGGEVIGIMPEFMQSLEWGHPNISQMHLVRDMHERKRRIVEYSDAFVALPGGCGTLEELFETITWKRLGLHNKPIIIGNIHGFYDHCISLLKKCIAENFMHDKHSGMWDVADSVDKIIPALRNTPPWNENALEIAVPS